MKALKRLFRELIRKELQSTYELGLTKGYELGKMMGETEKSNRGFIVSSKVREDVESIMTKAGY